MPRMFSSYCGCATYNVKRTARTKRRPQANVVRTLAEEIVPGSTELFPCSKRQQESVELLRILMESSSEEERADSENSLDITVESNQEGQPELESPNVFNPDSPPANNAIAMGLIMNLIALDVDHRSD